MSIFREKINKGSLEKKEIYAIKEEYDVYRMRVISTYTSSDRFIPGCDEKIIYDIEEKEFETREKLFFELFSYLNKHNYLIYTPTQSLKDINDMCDENTCVFNVSLIKNFNCRDDNLEIFFRLNKYEDIILNIEDEINDIKEFERYICNIIKQNLNINISINLGSIKHYYSYKDLYYKDLYNVAYKMINDFYEGRDIYFNNLYDDIIIGLNNFKIEYFLVPKHLEKIIKKSKSTIIKYKSDNKIKTWDTLINIDKYTEIEQYSRTILDIIYDILSYNNIYFDGEITTFYDSDMKIVIIYLYYIDEVEIHEARDKIQEVERLMF